MRQTDAAQSPTTLPGFKKHFIYIILLNSQATESSLTEEDTEAGTGTGTSIWSQRPGHQTGTLTPGAQRQGPGRAAGAPQGSLPCRALRSKGGSCTCALHQEMFAEVLLCARSWLRPAVSRAPRPCPQGAHPPGPGCREERGTQAAAGGRQV